MGKTVNALPQGPDSYTTLIATLLWGPNCLLVLALGTLGPIVSLLLEEEGAEIFVTAEN